MARCPRCSRHFRTLEDEEGMHDCPHCGYFPEPEPMCEWCSQPVTEEDNQPYCCSLCSVQAELDSLEDSE